MYSLHMWLDCASLWPVYKTMIDVGVCSVHSLNINKKCTDIGSITVQCTFKPFSQTLNLQSNIITIVTKV